MDCSPETFDSANCSRTDAASSVVDLMRADALAAFAVAARWARAAATDDVDAIDASPLGFRWRRPPH